MNTSGLPLYQTTEVRQLDKLAIAHQGISGYQLMCRAGQAALNVLLDRWPKAKQIEICCGSGNNGGDGFVLARLAKAQGLRVLLYGVGEVNESKLSLEAKQARSEWLSCGGEIIRFQGQAFRADVIVDALLGTGFKVPLAVEYQQAILSINQSESPVLALDLPSGLQADTGHYEEAVEATVTITFIAMKLGLVSGAAINVVGELILDNLGISVSTFPEVKPKAWSIEYQHIIQSLPARRLASHKGDNGHVCIVGGGQTGYSGAVCLAGEAALRAGAGLVSAVVCPESLPLLARSPAELMCYGLSHPKELKELFERATFIILGPGLSQSKWGEKFFHDAIKTTKPCLIDADGLNWLAKYPQNRNNWILTPHPGEAARLLGTTTQQVQQDRISAAFALEDKYGGVIVLKGAGSIVVTENRDMFVNIGGFPALASGGTGDVLAGLIGGLAAQGLTLGNAACLGVSVHTNAAYLEQTIGARGMLASDLFLHMRTLVNFDEDL
ncbi:MAG: NAD(P)H-hydrate dehydratase [Gammaproteobacteria bacterium]|nr:NAD(P)H-hydrate dehydratase [Gammaproteobacteria bacterium]